MIRVGSRKFFTLNNALAWRSRVGSRAGVSTNLYGHHKDSVACLRSSDTGSQGGEDSAPYVNQDRLGPAHYSGDINLPNSLLALYRGEGTLMTDRLLWELKYDSS